VSKALFWDFDGTLVYNSGYIWDDSLHEILMELGYDIGIEKIYQHCSSQLYLHVYTSQRSSR